MTQKLRIHLQSNPKAPELFRMTREGYQRPDTPKVNTLDVDPSRWTMVEFASLGDNQPITRH